MKTVRKVTNTQYVFHTFINSTRCFDKFTRTKDHRAQRLVVKELISSVTFTLLECHPYNVRIYKVS